MKNKKLPVGMNDYGMICSFTMKKVNFSEFFQIIDNSDSLVIFFPRNNEYNLSFLL